MNTYLKRLWVQIKVFWAYFLAYAAGDPDRLPLPPYLVPLGRMAIFYLPSNKLALPDNSPQWQGGRTLEEAIDEALIKRYQGVTKITQNVEGHYHMGSQVVKDDHVRYEVSFLGKVKVREFIAFLRDVCVDMEEESIYLTMGQRAYLIEPKS